MKIFRALVLVAALGGGSTAKTRVKRSFGNEQDIPMYNDEQALPDYAPQPVQAFNQQPAYYPVQGVQGYPQGLVQTAEDFDGLPASAYEQPVQVQNFPGQQAPVYERPVQTAVSEQPSFLAASSRSESATVMGRLTEVLEQQSKTLAAIQSEQHQLARFETIFAERSIDAMEALATVPECKTYTKPAKVTDDPSCDKACTENSYSTGDWVENEWEGLAAAFETRTHRCECEKKDGPKKTICTDSTKMATTPLLGTLGMLIMLLQM